MPTYTLQLNSTTPTVEAEADMPLLWVLRDKLGLTGTKYGCGEGLCGACTVHVEGEAVRSCQLPISEVGRRAITTIEGLAEEHLHVVQQAWIDEQVPQCGYCQSGQIMQAVALFKRTRKPTDADIDLAMAGNLCRCGTYVRIRRAIHRVAEAGRK